MSDMKEGTKLDILTDLGNGYDLSKAGDRPLLLGGGVGVPPLYLLAKKLIADGKNVSVILGFNTKDEVFYEDEFKALGAKVFVSTVDGSYGTRGFVTDVMRNADYSYFYTCGPEPMLKAVCKVASTSPAGDDVGEINAYSYLRHEFEQAKKRKRTIIIVYNSLYKQADWLPDYMDGYDSVAHPFWVRNSRGEKVGDYQFIKEALGYD